MKTENKKSSSGTSRVTSGSARNIAIIGAGYWGKNLVRNFYQLGVLKIVCDNNASTLKEIEKEYEGLATTGKMEDLLGDKDIRGIVVATPAALHKEIAEKALRADKHVFVEKPMSLTYADGQELVNLAEQRGKILFVGHVLHYHPAIIKLKEMIRKGGVGRLQYIYSRRLSLGKIRREENILWSFAPHDISIILSLAGEEPSYIDSVGNNFLHARIADVTMTNMKFPSGIGAHIFVSWLNPFKEQRLVVVGDKGMLVFDDTRPVPEKLVFYPHTIKWQNAVPIPDKGDEEAIDLTSIWEEPLKAECKAFIESMKSGAKPLTSGEEGLQVLRILEISQKSLEDKEQNVYRPVKISPEASSLPYFAHESAVIDDNVSIGRETKIWHFSHVLSGSTIGERCNIGQNVVIGPDVKVGNGCKIQNNVSVYKGVILEDGVFCGPSMVFTNVNNPRAEISRMDEARSTLVKKGATIGANATIVCGNTIGRYAFIGAGAVITRDVPEYALMVGNPARQIGWMCECGQRLSKALTCDACGKKYKKQKSGIKKN